MKLKANWLAWGSLGHTVPRLWHGGWDVLAAATSGSQSWDPSPFFSADHIQAFCNTGAVWGLFEPLMMDQGDSPGADDYAVQGCHRTNHGCFCPLQVPRSHNLLHQTLCSVSSYPGRWGKALALDSDSPNSTLPLVVQAPDGRHKNCLSLPCSSLVR